MGHSSIPKPFTDRYIGSREACGARYDITDAARVQGRLPEKPGARDGRTVHVPALHPGCFSDPIISTHRNTACICVHSRTDKEHCGLFLDTSSSAPTLH
jgi:hypothetical protein